MRNLKTPAENTWCPGCGNFGILSAVRKAVARLEDEGVTASRLAISAGIGCHAKIFDYLALSGFYSIHGREMATVQGMKLANPDLSVIAFAGDGDAYGEGLVHLLFAAKRNADITVVVHDNGVYGLTTGQFTPTSPEGFKGPSTPGGNVERPFNPLALMLEAGATFVARGYPGSLDHLADLIVRAVRHRGCSFIDVLQPCVTYNDTYDRYNEHAGLMDDTPATLDEALARARQEDPLLLGVFRDEDKPTFHEKLMPDRNPVRDRLDRASRIRRMTTLYNNR
ncbi:2-oxoacid:ferredoxin oxidoreductase subunit beta [candidate division WOR-3 bacterium]|nr:2-oxoacid:ferredoxin oxidoreductase subunit beta [candidate division WOR-3 bacterium]